MKLPAQTALALLLLWPMAALTARAALPAAPLPAAGSAPALGGSAMLQAGLGMLLVLGLIFLCAWLARRFGLQRLGGPQLVKVVSSAVVGQRERVVVVEVGGAWLVLGVTAHQVNALHTLAAQALPAAHEASAAGAHEMAQLFADKLRQAVTGRPRPNP